MDKLRAMEVFVSTVDAGSFSAAAEALDLSAGMVGKHIRALEAQLDARLIDRTTRRHALTEIGAAYLERCRDVLTSVHTADGVAEALRAAPQGTLRVTAPVTYGAHPEEGLRACSPLGCFSSVNELSEWLKNNA